MFVVQQVVTVVVGILDKMVTHVALDANKGRTMVDPSIKHKSRMVQKEEGVVLYVICIWNRRSLSTQAFDKVTGDVLPNEFETAIDTHIFNVFLLRLPFISNSMS